MKKPPVSFTTLLLAASLIASCNQKASSQNESTRAAENAAAGQTASADCTPLETRKPESPKQKPTFAGQTRVCAIKSNTAFEVIVVSKGLEKPWAIEPLPDGDLLVTEKPGRMRVVSATGVSGQPLGGLPPVKAGGQGGLLDVALSPKFATDRTVFWSFTDPRPGGSATSVARGVLSQDKTKLEQVKIILKTMPEYDNSLHFGSRLAFGPDGYLYVTMGERSDKETRPQAQHMNSHLRKILRITTDGKPAPGNPFTGQATAKPEIWTVGHRNVQSSAFDAAGKFWIVEMGPSGGDEVNLVEKGKNYGWPMVTFGEEYSGLPVPDAVTHKEGFEDPVYYWDPVIAPSGAEFYTGSAFPEWKGNLFVGALREQRLVRLKIGNNKVVGEEHLLTDRGERIRDVKQGPDGALYVVTDNSEGEIWKIVPKK